MSLLHKNHPNITLQLPTHCFHRLSEVEPGMTVTCEKGLLWVTQAGNRQDYTLRPGQHVTIESKGQVLIEAVSESNLKILYPN